MKKISWKQFIDSLPNVFTPGQYRQLEEGNAECERLFKDFFVICHACEVRKEWINDNPYPDKCWNCIEKQTNVINEIVDKKFPFYSNFIKGE